MSEKQYLYILSRYVFYGGEYVLMVSSSCDEITTYFIRAMRQLPNQCGLQIVRYEFGKYYKDGRGKTIRHIEREDGKIKDLMELEE